MTLTTMNTAKIRKKLHQYIDNGDERFLRLLHALAVGYEGEEDYTLPGSPMELKTYRTRIKNTSEREKAGFITTKEDLEKEMEQW